MSYLTVAMTRARREVLFHETGDARVPFAATVDGERWRVRLNEFPEEPSLYTLIVDGEVVEELMEWPKAWQRGAAADAHEQAEYDREIEQLARTRHIKPSKLVK